MSHGSPRCANGQLATVEQVLRAIPVLGGFVDNLEASVIEPRSSLAGGFYLIVGRENVVSKLYFSDRCCAGDGGTDAETDDALFTQGCIKYTIGS